MGEDQSPGQKKDDTELERIKVGLDLMKHVSIMAAGSVVLLATVIGELPKPSQGGTG